MAVNITIEKICPSGIIDMIMLGLPNNEALLSEPSLNNQNYIAQYANFEKLYYITDVRGTMVDLSVKMDSDDGSNKYVEVTDSVGNVQTLLFNDGQTRIFPDLNFSNADNQSVKVIVKNNNAPFANLTLINDESSSGYSLELTNVIDIDGNNVPFQVYTDNLYPPGNIQPIDYFVDVPTNSTVTIFMDYINRDGSVKKIEASGNGNLNCNLGNSSGEQSMIINLTSTAQGSLVTIEASSGTCN